MNESVISAQALSKRIKDKTILREISVVANPGDIVGVLGKNGAGKTTLFEVLLGFSPPSQGDCRIFGHTSTQLSEQLKARIGFVPQQDELVNLLSGEQQLQLVASFYKHWDHGMVQRLAADWEVPLKRRITQMSGGERQKLSTLLALGHRPELLVLDEPVASLDPIARRRFIQQIFEIAESQLRTVLLSSHIVSDVERVANRVWMMREGGIVYANELDALKESVVRLHVHGKNSLRAPLLIPGQLSCRIDGNRATVGVRHWRQETQQSLALALDASIEVEALSLEDIFVEFNR
jgi:ABC-2 type transport system ATP-binding protein